MILTCQLKMDDVSSFESHRKRLKVLARPGHANSASRIRATGLFEFLFDSHQPLGSHQILTPPGPEGAHQGQDEEQKPIKTGLQTRGYPDGPSSNPLKSLRRARTNAASGALQALQHSEEEARSPKDKQHRSVCSTCTNVEEPAPQATCV